MYKSLASWRGLLVVIIVLYHTPILSLTEAAHMGVSFFFLMSGAMLAMRHPRVDCGWRQWMWPRARRIYAIHWLVLAVLMLLLVPQGSAKAGLPLLANGLLVHTWVPVREVYLSYNKPTWFLSALLVCYACYPVLSALLGRLPARGKWLVAIVIMASHIVVMGMVDQQVRDWLFVMPIMRVGEFVWGMTLGASMPAMEKRWGNALRSHATMAELAVIAVAVVFLIAVRRMPWLDCCEDIAAWWIPNSLIIATSVMLSGNEGATGRLLASRPMQWLGSINLEVYMLSAAVTYFYSHYVAGIMAHLGHPEFYSINWPITLPLTLIAATVLHPLFKKRQ